VAHALEAVGVVALFAAFDALLQRTIEPGFYIFLFALWFTLSLMRYFWYVRYSAFYRRMVTQPVATQLWWTSNTFVWVVFILLAFALYETMVRRAN
jgi:cobalamin synthase